MMLSDDCRTLDTITKKLEKIIRENKIGEVMMLSANANQPDEAHGAVVEEVDPAYAKFVASNVKWRIKNATKMRTYLPQFPNVISEIITLYFM